MAVESIRIQVSETGSRSVSRDIEQIGGSAGKAAVQANRLRSALQGLAFATGALQLGKLLDTFTNMQNRLRLVTTGTAQLGVVTQELFRISNSTRTSFESTAEIYSRTALAVKDLGLSQAETLTFTERLNKTIILSGASAAEAQGAMIQLSQGLASGTLRGDELRSVLEQLPAVADVIAKGLGVTRGELRKLGAEGKISAKEVIDAYKKLGSEIDANFATTIPTMGQALVVLQNKFLEVVSSIDQSLGITRNIASAILAVSDHMDTLTRIAGVLAVAILTNLIPALVRLAATLIVPIFVANPFVALIGGSVVAVAAIVAFGDKLKVAEDGITTFRDVAGEVWDRVKDGARRLADFIGQIFTDVTGRINVLFGLTGRSFGDVVRSIARGLDTIYNAFGAAYDTILQQWRSFPAAFADLIIQAVVKAYEAIVELGKKVIAFLKGLVEKVLSADFSNILGGSIDTKVEGAAARVAETFQQNLARRMEGASPVITALDNLFEDSHQRALKRIEEERKAEEEAAKARLDLSLKGVDRTKPSDEDGNKRKGFKEYLEELQREQQLGLAVGDAYKILNEQIQISNKLRRDLTDTEKVAVEEAVKANLELERKRALLDELVSPQRDYNDNISALNQLYLEGAITIDQFNEQFFKLRENFLNGLPEATTFADGFTIQIEKMQLATRNGFGQMGTEVAKIFGPGGTLINGIGDAVAQSVVFGKSFKEQIHQIAQSILSQLIGSLVKMGINMVAQAALNSALGAASTAQGVAQAGALTAAYTPAAAVASLATGGTNAAGAGAGISSIFSILTGLVGAIGGRGFKDGGYTGPVGVNQVAGVVHGQEFVMNAQATSKHRATLEALNSGKSPFAAIQTAPEPRPVTVSITNEIPDAAYETRSLTEGEIEIIARRVVRREAPDVVANDLRSPNSKTSKSLSQNTLAGRRR